MSSNTPRCDLHDSVIETETNDLHLKQKRMSANRCYVGGIVFLVLVLQVAMIQFAKYLLGPSSASSGSATIQKLPDKERQLHRCQESLANLSITTGIDRRQHEQQQPPPLFCSNEVLGEKQRWNHNKKVISYSIFGPNHQSNNDNQTRVLPGWVLHGIERNMLDAQLYYPDWVVRVYTMDLPQELQDKWLIYNATIFHNVELVKCFSDTPMTKSNSRKMMTRYLAYDDPKIWYTLVRDADSLFTLREVMAVNEFLAASMAEDNFSHKRTDISAAPSDDPKDHQQSYKNSIYFHAMRDHKDHNLQVTGGMFGMKRGMLQSSPTLQPNTTMTHLIVQAFENHPETLGGCCGEDQQFLSSHLWQHVRMLTLDHDMMPGRCQAFGAKRCREYPLGPRNQDIKYFVGSPFKYKNATTGEWHPIQQQHSCELQCKLTNETSRL